MARRKRFHWGVGELECRALLSGITYTLTTDQSSYQVGQPILITFTETNTSDQQVTVSVSPTDFTVAAPSGNGWNPIWDSNPENAGQPPTPTTLQPGQSLSQTATWDGTVPYRSQAVNLFGAFTVSNPNAPSGDTASFQVANPLRGSLTTDQSTYTVGQPVRLTYTETNTSGQAITISTSNPLYQILHDGQPVLPVADPPPATLETIAPGQTITNQYTWTGQSAVGSSSSPLTGPLVAEVYGVPAPPGDFTADFQIVSPSSTTTGSSGGTDSSNGGTTAVSQGGTGGSGVASVPLFYSTVSTNKGAYKVGQSVRITLNIRQRGNTAAALPPLGKHEVITITDGSKVIWKATRKVGRAARMKTIAPGQVIKAKTVWNGRPNQPGVHGIRPGTYEVEVTDGNYGGMVPITIGLKRS